MGPTRFPVAIITSPLGPIRTNDRTFQKFQEVPVWRKEDQSAAVDSLVLSESMDAETQH